MAFYELSGQGRILAPHGITTLSATFRTRTSRIAHYVQPSSHARKIGDPINSHDWSNANLKHVQDALTVLTSSAHAFRTSNTK